MSEQLLCPYHGPYDAAYGTCPYCSGALNRPVPPPPLGQSELPTDLGEYPPQQVNVPGQVVAPGMRQSEMPTDLGNYPPGPGQPGAPAWPPRPVDETVLDEEEAIGPMALLWVKEGPKRGVIHRVEGGTVVGRKEGSLKLEDPKVSSPHAKFTLEAGEFILWDFASSNGTFVNGQKIREATILKENDEVKIGETTFVFKVMK